MGTSLRAYQRIIDAYKTPSLTNHCAPPSQESKAKVFTIPKRMELGARCKARRLDLGLSRQATADAVRTSAYFIKRYEEALPPEALLDETELEIALNVPTGWLRDDTIATPKISRDDASVTHALPRSFSSRELQAHLEKLAARAKQRRVYLGLAGTQVARLVNTHPRWIYQLECRLTHSPTAIEPLWEDALRVPRGWLRNEALLTPPDSVFPYREYEPGMTVAAEIRMVCCWLSASDSQERYVSASNLRGVRRRIAEANALYFGVEGENCTTNEAIALSLKVSAKRVSELRRLMCTVQGNDHLKLPALERLVQLVETLVPAPVDVIDERLRDLLGEHLSIVGVENFTREILGRSHFIFPQIYEHGASSKRTRLRCGPQGIVTTNHAVFQTAKQKSFNEVSEMALECIPNAGDRDLLAAYLGLNGKTPSPMPTLASNRGITRERVRQRLHTAVDVIMRSPVGQVFQYKLEDNLKDRALNASTTEIAISAQNHDKSNAAFCVLPPDRIQWMVKQMKRTSLES